VRRIEIANGGRKLKKGPLDVIVIESVEQPTPD